MSHDLFLGKFAQPEPGERAIFSPDRFTTHAVVIGMTGSGKTGLIVDVLEEVALAGIPTLVVDPKGDLTNRLLVFPDLRPEDFQPFCPEGRAQETASRWAQGLAAWGFGATDLRALKAQPLRIFTPGASTSPLNVLQRFEPPSGGDAEAASSSALGAVASLFVLAGLDDDPSTSPGGLLLSQILLKSWAEGRALSLEELVQQVLSPPLQRIGVMDLDAVIPAKERTALAMKLNALLASPSLALWRQGPVLDFDLFLGPQAGGSTTIFTLAHLSEGERLFFLGLLLSELAAWTRRQPGSDRLRALVVFDEVYGFFPPHPLNPPTKGPLLTLLKQARAFGVGLLLASQNPVDLDYKGLTNAGLWFLGRLQTDPDRERVADALGALPGGGDAATLLADIPPRRFLVHDVRSSAPRLMETRQCMSYLAGPLTPPQLKALLPKAAPAMAAASDAGVATPKAAAQDALPVVPAGWQTGFGSGQALVPCLVVQADVTYRVSPKAAPIIQRKDLLWPLLGESLEGALAQDARALPAAPPLASPAHGASCAPLPPFFDRTDPTRASKAAASAIVVRQTLTLLRDPLSGLLQDPSEGENAFRQRASAARSSALQEEADRKLASLTKQLQRAQDQVSKRELELQQDQTDASARTAETVVSAGLGLLGGLFGSRRSIGGAISRTVSKTRMAARAKGEVEQDAADLESARRQRDLLQQQLDEARREIADRAAATPFETVTLTPAKSGVQVLACRLLWAEQQP
jgi:hypothetical protein